LKTPRCVKLARVSHPPARTDLACRNCGAQAPLKFCPECGQETTLHPPTLGEFLHEFVGHYVALEGALWATLRLLLTRPGQLTREYLLGRRRQYVLPLRLYLTCSFLFFLALRLLPAATPEDTVVLGVTGKRLGTVAELQASAAAAARVPSSPARTQAIDCGAPGQPRCNAAESIVNRSVADFGEHPQETVEHMRAHMLAYAPYLVFLLLPVFAGIMMLTYRNRRMTYGEHVVFSLHLHAFWFLLGLTIAVLPDAISGVLQLAVPVYGCWAMHAVYGGRWVGTIARALVASALYTTVLALASLAGATLLLAMG
jgi:hypothetical protein